MYIWNSNAQKNRAPKFLKKCCCQNWGIFQHGKLTSEYNNRFSEGGRNIVASSCGLFVSTDQTDENLIHVSDLFKFKSLLE